MNCSMPGFPVPEFAQIHVHWGGDTIESSLLSPRSPPALSLSQHQGLFQWVCSRHQVAKVLELQVIISPSSEYSGSIFFRIGASLVAQRLKHLPAKGLTGLILLSKGLLRALWYKLCMYPWCHSRGASSRLKKTMLTMLCSKVNECTRTTHFLPNVSDSENSFHFFFYLIYVYMQRNPGINYWKTYSYFWVSLIAHYSTYEIQTICIKYKGILVKRMVSLSKVHNMQFKIKENI